MSPRAQEPWIHSRRTYVAAASWAMVVGGLLAVVAALLGMDIEDVATLGLLAGFGAAGFVIWFSTQVSRGGP